MESGAVRSGNLNHALGGNQENTGIRDHPTGVGKEKAGKDANASKDGDPQEL